MSDKHINPLASDRELAIMIPGNKFAEFITGLLGKPQTIVRSIRGSFSITRDDLVSLHHLLEQRVHEQNKASLIQVQFKIIYNGELSVEINSLSEFLQYAEVRRVTTLKTELTWIYLIEFQGKSIPERQQIEVSFARDFRPRDHLSEIEDMLRSKRLGRYKNGGMRIRVTHTTRSWGADIESLLHDHLQVFQQHQTGIPWFLWKFSTVNGWATGLGLFSVVLLVGSSILAFIIKKHVLKTGPIAGNVTLDSINSKLDSLVGLLSAGTSSTLAIAIAFYVIVGIVISTALGVYVGESSEEIPSTISFTPHDENLKTELLAKYRNNWKTILASAICAITLGVASNLLFVLVW
jgi:hypothetical protein